MQPGYQETVTTNVMQSPVVYTMPTTTTVSSIYSGPLYGLHNQGNIEVVENVGEKKIIGTLSTQITTLL